MKMSSVTMAFVYRRLVLGWLVLLGASLFALLPAKPATALDFPVALDVEIVDRGEQGASIVMVFDKQAQVSHQLLDSPWRLMLDFEKVGYGFDPDDADWSGKVSNVRWGDMSAGTSRVIFEMVAPFSVSEIRWVEETATGEQRLEIDIAPTSEQAYREEMDRTLRTGSVVTSSKSDRLGAVPLLNTSRSDEFIVILDPGHGGIDSGAVGRSGTLEKDITLTFSHELKALLEELGPIRVYMTREADVFKPLNDRVRFARERGASLFVSIHADSVRQDYVRGATVYTISDRASDEVAAQVAASENLSDEIAGITVEHESSEVVDILVDMARRETHGFSVQFARIAIDEIGNATRLIRNAHRYAGFRVLRAPDVPSVLLELGYLSNIEDERLLNDPEWRARVADTLAQAIARFAKLSGHQLVVQDE